MIDHVIKTNDGSASIFSTQFNESYHSIHGAVQESMHIFINIGLMPQLETITNDTTKPHQINIFEMGFGTGLNALLSYIHLLKYNATQKEAKNKVYINYLTCEKYPIDLLVAHKLKYSKQIIKLFNSEQANSFNITQAEIERFFISLHNVSWNSYHEVFKYFNIYKYKGDINDCLQDINPEELNLIYYDAFSPSVQPELWTEDIFSRLYTCSTQGTRLVTYCAKGIVKRMLKSIGYKVFMLPGPPGKLQVTLACR